MISDSHSTKEYAQILTNVLDRNVDNLNCEWMNTYIRVGRGR